MRRTRTNSKALSLLQFENRLAPAINVFTSGTSVSFTGDAANDSLYLSVSPTGTLLHNVTGSGLASATDVNPIVPGTQEIPVSAITSLNLLMGDGTDYVSLTNVNAPGTVVSELVLLQTLNGGSITLTDTSFTSNGKTMNMAGATSVGITCDDGNNIIDASAFTLHGVVIDGLGGQDTITGTGFDDLLHGGDGGDIIKGGPGNDFIDGEKGEDILYGDDGNDALIDGIGIDFLFGGDGDDSISVGENTISLPSNGGPGFDTLIHTNVMGTATLTDQHAVINNIDMMAAGFESFELHSSPLYACTIDASEYTLTPLRLYGNKNNDTIIGGSQNDYIDGGDGTDSIHGGPGSDTISGGNGSDHLYGDDSDDTLYGGNNDSGDLTSEVLSGGNGNDSLFGEAGTDTLFGDAGNDLLNGGDGRDIAHGGDGDDIIAYVGSGNSGSINWDFAGTTGDAGNDRLVASFVSNATLNNTTSFIGGYQFTDFENYTLIGTPLNDSFNASAFSLSPVELYGLGGDDLLISGSSNSGNSDVLNGGDGNDTIKAGSRNSTLDGGSGTDSLQLTATAGDDGISIDTNAIYITESYSTFNNFESMTIDAGDGIDSGYLLNSTSNPIPFTALNLEPAVAVGPSIVSTETNFSRSGSFSDPGMGQSWTAQVNYGDGFGWQPLTLNTDSTFLLNFTNTSSSARTITVKVTDDQGNTGSKSFVIARPVSVTITPGIAGQASNSIVRTVTVQFDNAVTLNSSWYTIYRLTPGAMPTSSAVVDTFNGGTRAVISFNGVGMDAGNSLQDGLYKISLFSNFIYNNGTPFDGDGNGTPGGDVTKNFHRLFGDSDGNRTVDANDFASFGAQFGATSFNCPFDFDNNGTSDASDFASFGARFGITL